MTNVRELHCHVRTKLQPYEENHICLAFFHGMMAQERMYNLALLNTEQDIVQKMDFTDIIDLFTAAKTGNDCFKCFVLRTSKTWISFSSISGPKILLLSV